MPTRRHYRRPNPDRRRALELLAGSRYGYTKAILRAHGFSTDMMVELVKAGLATTKRERMAGSGRQTDVAACGSRTPAGKRLAKICNAVPTASLHRNPVCTTRVLHCRPSR